MATRSKKTKLSLDFKGEYDPSVTYEPFDVVTWHNGMYICGIAVTGIAPDKCSGSGMWAHGSSYWLPSLVNFRMINTSDTANGFNYLQMFTQGSGLYAMITRSPYISNIETQCIKIF